MNQISTILDAISTVLPALIIYSIAIIIINRQKSALYTLLRENHRFFTVLTILSLIIQFTLSSLNQFSYTIIYINELFISIYSAILIYSFYKFIDFLLTKLNNHNIQGGIVQESTRIVEAGETKEKDNHNIHDMIYHTEEEQLKEAQVGGQ